MELVMFLSNLSLLVIIAIISSAFSLGDGLIILSWKVALFKFSPCIMQFFMHIPVSLFFQGLTVTGLCTAMFMNDSTMYMQGI